MRRAEGRRPRTAKQSPVSAPNQGLRCPRDISRKNRENIRGTGSGRPALRLTAPVVTLKFVWPKSKMASFLPRSPRSSFGQNRKSTRRRCGHMRLSAAGTGRPVGKRCAEARCNLKRLIIEISYGTDHEHNTFIPLTPRESICRRDGVGAGIRGRIGRLGDVRCPRI